MFDVFDNPSNFKCPCCGKDIQLALQTCHNCGTIHVAIYLVGSHYPMKCPFCNMSSAVVSETKIVIATDDEYNNNND